MTEFSIFNLVMEIRLILSFSMWRWERRCGSEVSNGGETTNVNGGVDYTVQGPCPNLMYVQYRSDAT